MLTFENNGIVPQGLELKKIIESYGWTLYDVTPTFQDSSFTYENMEKDGSAMEFRVSGHYMFTPIPESGQSLREAYAVTMGVGPVLYIENPNETERWLGVELYMTHTFAVFSRMMFATRGVVLSSPRINEDIIPDWVAMPYDTVVETFQRHFRIVSQVDFTAEVLMSNMRSALENNRN
ncbi:hypothetical protein C4544_01575 [candidate division WS5 bacterium]|uniref:Uncharacterized protein n=1 Tax=candidate division WS5 bacterium TaxID=2093353 RepID=A0A419DFJ8_9BACT|nr:MAG: hypothetical protein C4544_01575 [candidate division WS5 bacterium]